MSYLKMSVILVKINIHKSSALKIRPFIKIKEFLMFHSSLFLRIQFITTSAAAFTMVKIGVGNKHRTITKLIRF